MTMKKDGAGEAEEGEIKETEEEELEPTIGENPCDDDMKPSGRNVTNGFLSLSTPRIRGLCAD